MHATVLNDKAYPTANCPCSPGQPAIPEKIYLQIIGICDSIDVALACDDEQIRAHRVNLSAWSCLLRNILF